MRARKLLLLFYIPLPLRYLGLLLPYLFRQINGMKSKTKISLGDVLCNILTNFFDMISTRLVGQGYMEIALLAPVIAKKSFCFALFSVHPSSAHHHRRRSFRVLFLFAFWTSLIRFPVKLFFSYFSTTLCVVS